MAEAWDLAMTAIELVVKKVARLFRSLDSELRPYRSNGSI
jgi:hypothetical protein